MPGLCLTTISVYAKIRLSQAPTHEEHTMGTEKMVVNVNIDPTDVDNAIVKAVINSHLGEAIKTAVEKFINSSSSYGSTSLIQVMENAVDQAIISVVRTIVTEDFKDVIAKAVREKLTEEVTQEFVGRAVDNMLRDRG